MFACGVMICLGVRWMLRISALVSMDWGTCRFISSPPKSALYGVVSLRFMRKVDQGRTRTWCPIILILWSEGWRLNTTRSPSRMWRSTWRNTNNYGIYSDAQESLG